MYPLRFPHRLITLLPSASVITVVVFAVTVALWRALTGQADVSALLAAIFVGSGMVSAWLVRRLSVSLPSVQDRAPFRYQAAGLQIGSVGLASIMIFDVEVGAGASTVFGVTAIVLFALSTMRLPNKSSTPAARLRRALDGMFVGGSVFISIWVLLDPARLPRSFVFDHVSVALLVVVTVGMVGIALVSVVRATHYRSRYVLLCSSFTIVSISYLAVVIATVGRADHIAVVLLNAWWGVCCFASVGATWWVGRSSGAAQAAPVAMLDSFVSWGPAVTAATVICWQSIDAGFLASDAVILSLLVVLILSARQVLARMDVKGSARKLAERESYFKSIVDGSSDVTTVLDGNRRVRWQAAPPEWKLSQESTTGMSFIDMVHPDDGATVDKQLIQLLKREPGGRIRVDARLRRSDGEWRDTESTVADQRNVRHVRGLVVHTRDVGERRSLERELAKLAYADTLTSLSNRRALLQALQSDVIGNSMPCSLLAIDLDGFKNVNDTQGHDIGDAVLIEVARRLSESLRPTDIAARLGGDEFAILLWSSPSVASATAQRLLEVLSSPYQLNGTSVFLSASIGLASCDSANDVESLLRNADLALRSAKQQGKNRIDTYDAAFEQRIRRENTLKQELRGAIGRNELSLVYQPVISLPQRHIVGAEALMRWNHSTLGNVSPGEFIPIIEGGELSDVLTLWTVQQVAERLATWRSLGIPAWVSMNLSPHQLHSPLFVMNLAQALLERGVPPARLVVEVTEHDVARDMDVLVAQLGALRGTGVRIALDDFGSGYSSLGQLHRLPVDILKIDRDLIAGSDNGAAPLADVVVKLGERLGLRVIAEGVESEAQLAVVEQAGCAMVQGYLLARPMPVSQIDLLLKQQAAVPNPRLAIES